MVNEIHKIKKNINYYDIYAAFSIILSNH